MRLPLTICLLAVWTSGCFEGKTVKNVQAPPPEGASSEDLTSEEISRCLDEGGSAKKVKGKVVCKKGTPKVAQLCSAKEVDEGIEITCAGKDPLLVKHGNSCQAKLVEEGVELQCGKDNQPLLIRHGSSCVVAPAEGGANISCPGSEAVFVAHGTNGVDGTSCAVTETDDGAIISCGSDDDQVAIKHGRPPEGLVVSEVIDPCGAHDGFDEILLRMNDGKLVAYFEDGDQNRFLTVLDPATDAGSYVTTDKQSCAFTVSNTGEVTW